MKKLLTILSLLLTMYACKEDTTINVTDPYVPPIIEEPDPIGNIRSIVFYDSGQVKFFDGSAVYVYKTGASVPAGLRKITFENKLYNLDPYSGTESIQSLLIVPDFCVVDLDENVWLGKITIPGEPDYKYYLDVYRNNIFYARFQVNIVNMFLSGSDITIIDINGAYYDVTGNKTSINYAGEFTIYDFDATLRTAKIDDVNISWSTNWMNGAKQWNNGYSWNGYTFLNNALIENGSCMTMWRNRATYPITLTENAVLVASGSSVFSGETHLFFIECNSGWLFRYIPATDTLEKEVRIYTGDGLRDTGIYYSKILNPVTNEDGIYFCFDDGIIYRYRFDSGQIGYISSYTSWLRSWK